MADIMCNDNRFEVIGRAKEHLLEATNIDTSPDEMAVLDSFLFRCWQMGWLDRYDDTADAIMPMTLENAIDFLDKIGWRAEHDRIMSTPQWIPCEERLPEKPKNYPGCEIHEVYYLVSLKDGFVVWDTYDFGKGAWSYTESPVIAWMPLPEPYGGERKDNECMERNDDARRSNEYE